MRYGSNERDAPDDVVVVDLEELPSSSRTMSSSSVARKLAAIILRLARQNAELNAQLRRILEELRELHLNQG